MRLNIEQNLVKQLTGQEQPPNKSRHLDKLTHEPAIWSSDTGQWLSCFDSCQLTVLSMVNVKDVDLPRHAWDTPPFLLIVSPTLPVQSVHEYVRTYARSITWHPNENSLTILYEYGALRGRGSPTTDKSCHIKQRTRECYISNLLSNLLSVNLSVWSCMSFPFYIFFPSFLLF